MSAFTSNKSRYRKLNVRFWGDEHVKLLDSNSKLFFAYCLTSPDMTSFGAMKTSIPTLSKDTGMKPKAIKDALKTLGSKVIFDTDANLLVVANFLKHNPPENPNTAKGYARWIHEFPECDLLRAYTFHVYQFLLEINEQIASSFIEGYDDYFGLGAWDTLTAGIRVVDETVCGTVNETVTETVGDTVALTVGQTTYHVVRSTYHVTRNTNTIPLTPKGRGRGVGADDLKRLEADFTAFWEAYPSERKSNRSKMLLKWRRLNPDPELAATILKALEAHKASDQWNRDEGRFIPLMSTWLNQARWETVLKPAPKVPTQPPMPPALSKADALLVAELGGETVSS